MAGARGGRLRGSGGEHAPADAGGGGDRDPGAAHVCLAVDDLDAVYAAMEAGGVEVHARPAALGAGTKMVYVRDPDGIFVEIIQPSEDLSLAALLALGTGDGRSLRFDRS